MRLLSSSALWWLFLSAIIILFYLLKLKRKQIVVPSVLLWKRALDEIEANAPFKRLRRNLLLMLQLLTLAALVFALARPLITTRALASGNTIIILDSTASMGARDEVAGSRLDRAKQLAVEMIAGLGSADRAAIIESSSRVTVHSPLSSDRSAHASAIAEIRETDAPGDLNDAVRLAEQLARSEQDANIVIISDGGADGTSNAGSRLEVSSNAAPGSFGVRFVRVGQRRDNVGIIALNSRQASGSGRQELFASIANFGDRTRTAAVELKVEGKLIDARTIEIGAMDRRALVFGSLSAGGLAELNLDVDDDLASDNVAYVFLPSSRRIQVGVIGENPFLLQALTVNPDIAARRIDATSIAANFDCLISEGGAVAGALDSNRPVLAIDPPDAAGFWRATNRHANPEITSVERSHPVNSFLNYADVHIETFTGRETASWLRPIVSTGIGPLIWAGDDGRRRLVMIGFDPARSDLPLKVEFPILLANSLSWLAGRASPSAERVVRVGQPATIRSSATGLTIITPAGDIREVNAIDGSGVFAETLLAGRYEVRGGLPFAASLLSEAESDITPRDSIKTRAGELSGQVGTFSSEREAWRWLALLALTVLLIEWRAYHRRIG